VVACTVVVDFSGEVAGDGGSGMGDGVIFGCVCEVVKCLNDFLEKTGKVSVEKAAAGDSCLDKCCFAV